MTEDELLEGQPRDGRRESTGRTGITIGILVVALAALLFYFFWSRTGARTEDRKTPAAPAQLAPG